ncbi:MAG: tetratricopeptide repeat protein, partial [Desulfomonilaceae bacterium]
MTTSEDNQISKIAVGDSDTIEDIERKLAQDPESASLHYNLGLALARAKQWEKAILAFRKAMKLRPGLLEARVNIAGVLLQQGDYDGCIEESLKA